MRNKYLFNISPKAWTVLSMWAHVFVGAVTTEYIMHHTTSVKTLLSAGAGAVVPLIYMWANPTNTFPAPNKALIAADQMVKSEETPATK
jgi:hypothetical protein